MDERVAGVLAQVFDVDPRLVVDEMARGQLDGWDSFRHMELVVALEAAFDVKLEFDEIVKMQNVAAIKQVLKARVR